MNGAEIFKILEVWVQFRSKTFFMTKKSHL